MLNRLAGILPLLLMLLTVAVPMVFGQDAAGAEDNSTRNQLVLGGLAVVILFIYFRRRNKRKSLE